MGSVEVLDFLHFRVDVEIMNISKLRQLFILVRLFIKVFSLEDLRSHPHLTIDMIYVELSHQKHNELLKEYNNNQPNDAERKQIEVPQSIVAITTNSLYAHNTETHSTKVKANREIILTAETSSINCSVFVL